MKLLQLFITLFILGFPIPAFAAPQTVTIGVNGMVCDFCARALEKVFAKKEEVSSIHVNMDDKIVLVNLKDGMDIDDAGLTQLVNNAGYDVQNIMRGNIAPDSQAQDE